MTTNPPILTVVAQAYRDAWRIFQAMPALVAWAALIVFMFEAVKELSPLKPALETLRGALGGYLYEGLQSLILVPIMIAMYRFLLLDERHPRYAFEPTRRSFRVFFGWLMLVQFGSVVITAVDSLTTQMNLPQPVGIFAVLASMVLVVTVWVRLTLIFPAVAVEAPGANLANALADTKGRGLRIFVIILIVLLPWLVTLGVLGWLLETPMQQRQPLGGVGLAVVAAVQTIVTMLNIAASACLLQAYAERLRAPS